MSVWARDPKDGFLYLHRATGMYYVRAKQKGKEDLFRKTGYKSRARARTKALMLLAEWQGKRRTSDVILFREFGEDYLSHLEKTTLRVRTKENARRYLKELIRELGHVDIAAINEGFVDEWLAEFRARKRRSTFGDYTKYLSKALRHAHRKGLIERLPRLESPDAPKKTGRVYTRDEIAALLSVSDPRLELQIRLCLQGFMRLREMLFLTWDRVDLDHGLISLRPEDVKTGSKTGKGREFFINNELKTLLASRKAKQKPGTKYVFPSPINPTKPTWSNKTAWRKAKREAGITGRARWHDLRHTALTWALVEGKQNPLLVSEYAGVSLRTIQRVYLAVTPEHTREIAEAIRL